MSATPTPFTPPFASRLTPFGTTIFTEMTLLAQKHGAVNLAQGFPDFDGPAFLREAAAKAIHAGQNQYARMFGLPALNEAIAASFSRRTGVKIDPTTMVTVTSGCTEAICAAMLGLFEPGDEVILFEPYYDSYRASVALAHLTPRVVTLRPPEPGAPAGSSFWFDAGELERAFTPKTRAILVNTPHNPTGKVFSRSELELIASLCQKHGVLAITDEVYEHLTFDPSQPHISLASLPGMADRTLTLSSLGKTFSLTGWKIGWAIGTPELMRGVRAAHQFMTFSTATPLQAGAASAAGLNDEAMRAIAELVEQLTHGRAILEEALHTVGFRVFTPAGAYFTMVDWTDATVPGLGRLGDRFADDAAFCRYLTEHVGVAAIPPGVFYEDRSRGRSLARFAFCKKHETLREGARRLVEWSRGKSR